MLDFRSNHQQFHWRDKEKEVLTKDVSKSCHERPFGCLRSQIFMGWLEMWRNFILGTWPIQPFCWDLLHSMVSRHLRWLVVKGQLAKLAVKGQPCISIDTLSLHFRPSAVSDTFLSLGYVYPSSFRAHTALKEQKFIFVHSPASGQMQQSCCSFLQFFTIKDFIKWKPATGGKNTRFFTLAKLKGLLCLLPFFFSETGIPTQICFFPFSMKVYIKTFPFNFPHCFFSPI